MTATTSSIASAPRTSVMLAAAIVTAGVANTIIAFSAIAAGASAGYAPLNPPVYLAFTIAGILAGYFGWRVVRRVSARPARLLRVLVPAVLVLSWIPDVILAITGFIPGTNLTGALALALMHAVVVAVAVPVYARVAPVR